MSSDIMSSMSPAHVFLSYAPDDQDTVEAIARRLQGDARLAFWFAPWHSVPGAPVQEQIEEALLDAQSCAVFVGGAGRLGGWQPEASQEIAMSIVAQRSPEQTPFPYIAAVVAEIAELLESRREDGGV